MSVVAGCSLFDGVLLAADCRATISSPNHPDIHSDNVLKVIAILPHTAIGFAGDIRAASYLLQSLLAKLKSQGHKDPINLSNWLPILFCDEFKKYTSRYGDCTVNFMIGSVLKDRPNRVSRKEIFELVRVIAFEKKRPWLPSLLYNLLNASRGGNELLDIPSTYGNILYTLKSPDFIIQHIPILQFEAIGKGGTCKKEIQEYYDEIFAWQPGNLGFESWKLRRCIRLFIEDNKIQSVGGLYPVLKVTNKGIIHIGMSTEIPLGGTKIELIFDTNSYTWKQKNITSGKETPLLMPWDFLKNVKQGMKNNTFNDLYDAYRDFREKE
jgi:hypothetical protein